MILGAFENVAKTDCYCWCVCPSALTTLLLKIYTCLSYSDLCGKLNFGYNLTDVAGSLDEELSTFMTIHCLLVLSRLPSVAADNDSNGL